MSNSEKDSEATLTADSPDSDFPDREVANSSNRTNDGSFLSCHAADKNSSLSEENFELNRDLSIGNSGIQASSSNIVTDPNIRKRADLSSDSSYNREDFAKKSKTTFCGAFVKKTGTITIPAVSSGDNSAVDAVSNPNLNAPSNESDSAIGNVSGNAAIHNDNSVNFVNHFNNSASSNADINEMFIGFTDKEPHEQMRVLLNLINSNTFKENVVQHINPFANLLTQVYSEIENRRDKTSGAYIYKNTISADVSRKIESVKSFTKQKLDMLEQKSLARFNKTVESHNKLESTLQNSVTQAVNAVNSLAAPNSVIVREISRLKRDIKLLKNKENSNYVDTSNVKRMRISNFKFEHLCVVEVGFDKFEEVKNFLNQVPEIKNGKFKIVRINPSEKKLYINCADVNSKCNIIAILLNEGYNCRDAICQTKFVKIGPICSNRSPSDFLDHLKNSDSSLRFNINDLKLFKVLKISNSINYFVFSINREVSSIIDVNPAVFFDCRKMFFKAFYPAKHCHKCSQFGHTTAFCSNNIKACPKCGGNHPLSECNNSDPITYKCVNCTSKRLANNVHSAWSKLCPIKKRYMKAIKNNLSNSNG